MPFLQHETDHGPHIMDMQGNGRRAEQKQHHQWHMERREEGHGETDWICKKNKTLQWNLRKMKLIMK
jgi:hypothetical protein